MTILAVNAMILEDRRLSGIGHYIVQLLEHFGQFNRDIGSPHRLLVYCRDDAVIHLDGIDGVEQCPVPGVTDRLGRVIAEQVRLPVMLRRAGVDILLNPAFTGPLWGVPRIVTTVHDLYFRQIPELMPRSQRTFLRTMVPLCCRRSARIITDSRSTEADLLHYYPGLAGKVTTVLLANRMPVVALPDADTATAAPFVLLVAALTGNKNPEPLVAAIAALRQRHPDLTLRHIGSDPDGLLLSAATRHGGTAWVDSQSGVSDAELADAYRDCLCFVIPSLYEGFGLPLLEAQALGAPVVSSNRGSLPEVGGSGAVYIDPTDATDIAAAIEQLILSRDRRRALRQAGFANVARFSWERTAQETWDVLFDRA